jgi:Ca2+-binding EF-hand superfamily protein
MSRKLSTRKLSTMMDREVMEAFRLFDRNMDGRITSKEITDLIGSLGGDSSCPHVQVGQTCQSKSVQG